jgi:hypothetical protein
MLTASIRHRRRLEYLFSFPGKSWWEFGAVRLRSKKRSCQQSSGNVFADLGLRDAGEKQTRVRLAVAIQDLKKFIKLIVSLFGSVPQWLITLLAMIDELLKLLQSVRLPATCICPFTHAYAREDLARTTQQREYSARSSGKQ